jgi:hypothetical protein
VALRARVQQRVAKALASLLRRVLAQSDTIYVWRRANHHLVTEWRRSVAADANPLLRAGAKYFSQFDEDGILLEILRRLGITGGRFLEIGVGDGTENNTIILMARGWSGLWIGGEPLAWHPSGRRLVFKHAFVTAENVVSLVGEDNCDVFCLDVDGNDFWIADAVLKRHRPRVLVFEYNGKFPPPIKFVKPYVPDHRWDHSDYFGVSLASWVDLLAPMGYRLVCCSYMGANAFFVREADAGAFSDVPADPAALFRQAVYLDPVRLGHSTSPQTLAELERR